MEQWIKKIISAAVIVEHVKFYKQAFGGAEKSSILTV